MSGLISFLSETRVARFSDEHPVAEALDLAVSPVVAGLEGCGYGPAR